MARIKLGPNITDIRGTIKEVCYSIWKSGVHYARSLAGVVANPKSADQSLIRELLITASKRWYDTLTTTQRAGWETLAEILSKMSGESGGGIRNLVPPIGGIMSGLNAYVAFYTRSYVAGLSGFWNDDAPVGATPPNDPQVQNVVWTPPNVVITWTDPTIVEVNSKIAVWLRSHSPTFHRQIAGYAALVIGTLSLDGAKGAGGGGIAFAVTSGEKLILQLQTVQPNGWASPGGQACEFSIP
jgi:hypothetical protein